MLRSENVVLAPLRTADIETFFEWINDRSEVQLAAGYKPIHEPAHAAWFESVSRGEDSVIFAIRLVEDDRLIGYVQLVEIDWRNRNAELRIRIGDPSDRYQRFGVEAGVLILRYAFEDLNLARVWAHVFATNEAVRQGARRVGFREEGTLRRAAYVGGDYVDVVVIGMLKGELKLPPSFNA